MSISCIFRKQAVCAFLTLLTHGDKLFYLVPPHWAGHLVMRQSNCSVPNPPWGHHFLSYGPGLFITLFLPCAALIDNFNPLVSEYPTLFWLHFPVSRPFLSHNFFLRPWGCPRGMGAEQFIYILLTIDRFFIGSLLKQRGDSHQVYFRSLNSDRGQLKPTYLTFTCLF